MINGLKPFKVHESHISLKSGSIFDRGSLVLCSQRRCVSTAFCAMCLAAVMEPCAKPLTSGGGGTLTRAQVSPQCHLP